MKVTSGTPVRPSWQTLLAISAGAVSALAYLAWGPAGINLNAFRPSSSTLDASGQQAGEDDAAPRAKPPGLRAAGEPEPETRASTAGVHPRTSKQRQRRAAVPGRTHEQALARADLAATHEPLAREAVVELLQESLGLLWPDRKFSAEDYERLTDDVLQVRAARRALEEVPVSVATAEFIARRRQELTDALADFELVTGVSPSALPDVLDTAQGLTLDEDDDGEDGDEVRELLSDFPPPG